ncbi:hypothetical protein MHN00_12380 [Alteromonas sp. Cnat2-8]|uniref:hypothetical protein n=1 Tax=Alteromonas sp. Cnat2-8 TaxID=2917728 RepID=UPI001EF53401|nr:hypothetical protein [Alteromonas sp. Cnat2-8]MCG7654355.1 hypothetical protein [Alteromonas sp. Cnat2-8]|tara:strand:- start:862 stop:1125 length:264 start_codon:yes stop_codon:yes gene_type:complete
MSIDSELEKTIASIHKLSVDLKDNSYLNDEAKEFGLRLIRENIEQVGGWYAATGVPTSVPIGSGPSTTNSNAKCPHCNNNIYVKKNP